MAFFEQGQAPVGLDNLGLCAAPGACELGCEQDVPHTHTHMLLGALGS